MNNKKGFSLIELLVVIAIIAILAALLLPALAKSKQSASKALCISNQKQLNYAMSQLALDSDDKIVYASAWHNEPTAPRAWVADSMSGGSRWSKWAQTERSLIWSPLSTLAKEYTDAPKINLWSVGMGKDGEWRNQLILTKPLRYEELGHTV